MKPLSAEEAIARLARSEKLPPGAVIECLSWREADDVKEAFRNMTWPVSTRADWPPPSEPAA